MPDIRTLQFTIRTPHAVVLKTPVHSIRVATETGQVGLRPRAEASVLAVEAGLVNVEVAGEVPVAQQFVGTAGGLLICDGQNATLFTPLAVVGSDAAKIATELDMAMHQPGSEMEARAALSKLEGHILNELRRAQHTESRQSPGELI